MWKLHFPVYLRDKDMCLGIRSAYQQKRPFERSILLLLLRHQRVIAEFSKPGVEHIQAEEIERRPGLLLSHRQTEILQRVASGDETKEIASALGLKVPTVRNHVDGIIQKLGAKNRAHAVVLALRSDLIK